MIGDITFSYDRVPNALYWKAMRAACAPVKATGGRTIAVGLWAVIWLVAMVAIGLLTQLPVVQRGGIAFLLGMIFMSLALVGFGRVTRMQMRKTLEREQTRRGPTRVKAGPGGVRFISSFGESRLAWRAVDAVLDLGTGTGLKTGLMVYPIPHDTLPEELTPKAFQALLDGWRATEGAA